ncbi:Smr/MutS family protein [Roseovarius sp. MBR-6]|uniref:Smr/MutS family protein n=1 Tax=Roseovarius sp. MBR-6 TaxID=3156459 RepID=UPI00339698CA
MTRKRHLRPEEEALWQEVARRTVPLKPQRPAMPLLSKPAPREDPASQPIAPFRPGPVARPGAPGLDMLPGLTDRSKTPPVAMDRKAFERLRRGKLTPEVKIDLHGMTLDQAHGALTGFILRAHGQGRRLVLVVTGKGKHRDDGGPIPVRQGVLRHNVPHWLRMAPLGPLVLQITEAHLRHGGGGAYYVYLKRQR